MTSGIVRLNLICMSVSLAQGRQLKLLPQAITIQAFCLGL